MFLHALSLLETPFPWDLDRLFEDKDSAKRMGRTEPWCRKGHKEINENGWDGPFWGLTKMGEAGHFRRSWADM